MASADPARGRRWRRRALLGGALGAGALLGARALVPWWLRRPPPREPSPAARAFADAALAGLDRALVWDVHCHVVGLGSAASGCWVNPKLQSRWHALDNLRFDAYRASAGIESDADADPRYVERLLALQRGANPAGKLVLLAFDLYVDEAGVQDRERSSFHAPDEYVFELARAHPEFAACASVHPYRRDALERLERAAAQGAVAIKWLPNAMGIDPASPRCDSFYAKLVELGLPLLTHTGDELAVHAPGAQELGNPQRLARALRAGVRVIAAHCASLGEALDEQVRPPRKARAFELWLRMMRAPEFGERLLGDLSATNLVNRDGDILGELLAARDLHERLLFGSDYPLIAIDPLVSTWWLARRGYLAQEDRPLLAELFEANPLLFDLVLKRRLRVVREGVESRFAASCFETAQLLRRA